jgi:hypothetical protein
MFGFRFWCLSALYTAGSALLLGVPTLLIPNHLFSRTVPTSPQDYVIWIISALLLGTLLALMTLYPMPFPKAAQGKRSLAGSGRAFGGAVLSFFSVGCPVCNKVVVLLLGVGGAMAIFNPLRPLLGLASIVLLSVTLFLRLRVIRYGCRLPTQKTGADKEG